MPTADAIRWFKDSFADEIEAAVAGTPFDLDMVCAIACQETGFIWNALRRKGLARDEILRLCVGDVLDAANGRRAFPTTRAELLAAPDGQRMYEIARKALEDMAAHFSAYRPAAGNPAKFCRGYGIFQYDLQFFRTDPGYFLDAGYADFAICVGRCVRELHAAMRRNGWQGLTALGEMEKAGVAIAYNAGRYRPERGLRQGHYDRNADKYYGEYFVDFLRLSQTVPRVAGGAAPLPAPEPGHAVTRPPSPVAATGPLYRVANAPSALRVRSAPSIDRARPTANVIGHLPDGHLVRVLDATARNGFLEIETSLNGARLHGFASADFLRPEPGGGDVPVPAPAAEEPVSGIVAAHLPPLAGAPTGRAAIATARSLNEPGQPGRQGTDADALRAEIAAIVAWLGVDKASHRRYAPRDGLTFCNIYAHDFCHLAGVYLPRVWWNGAAIERLARGETVEPRIGGTVDEQRANALFDWLRDFGLRFGWRQTGSLTSLQLEANQGAIGLIVAKRRDTGRPGHITIVVPETGEHAARRDAAGEVVAPLQSQAGTTNFRYGTGTSGWWRGAQFVDFAFWLHS